MNKITFVKRNVSDFHPSWRWQSSAQTLNEVLHLTFGYLSYLDLCKCASISKTWRKLALDELTTRCTVNVKTDEEVRFVIRKLKTCKDFRVGKCILSTLCIDSACIKQFFQLLQNTMNVLKLDNVFIENVDLSLKRILTGLPNLTHLSVISPDNKNRTSFADGNCRNFPFSCDQPPFPRVSVPKTSDSNTTMGVSTNHSSNSTENMLFVHHGIRHLHLDMAQTARAQLSKIFYTFPNLVDLAISNVTEESRKTLKGLPRECLQPNSLKHLSVRQYSTISFSEKIIKTLMRLDMRLETLMLIFHPPTHSPSKTGEGSIPLLKQYIESQGTTLKSLKLVQVEDVCQWDESINSCETANSTSMKTHARCRYHWNFNYSFSPICIFPMILQNLEILHLQKPFITNLAQVLKHFPKLKQLSIQVSHGCNWKGMLPQALEPHLGISIFKLDFIDSDSFTRLGDCFPSLKTLQLAYCDESLFNLLCKQIPYFNGLAAKKNLISCQHCHGIGGQTFTLQSTEQEKENTMTPFGKELRRHCAQRGESNPAQKPLQSFTKRPTAFKNLKLLRIRVCHHFPFENFVFLRNGMSQTSVQSLTDTALEENVDRVLDSDDFDSSFGFTWNAAGIMKNRQFVDLPLKFCENTESCSSA